MNSAADRSAFSHDPIAPDQVISLSVRVGRGWQDATAHLNPDGWFPLIDRRGDIAVLELADPLPPGATPALLRAPQYWEDREFRTQGFPDNIVEGVGAHGYLKAGLFIGNEWIQLEAQARGRRLTDGFSGAPVFDIVQQAVVGMVVAEDADDPAAGIGAMIPLDLIAERWPPLGDLLPSCVVLDPGYWDARARGVEHPQRPGWFFSGRQRIMRDLINWLKSPFDPQANVMVLTARGFSGGDERGGGPGSGKSAILARLVTLSDRQYRTRMGRQGIGLNPGDPVSELPLAIINVAILASGATTHGVLSQIAMGMAFATPAFEATGGRDEVDIIIDRIIQNNRSCVIVIDGVDEALSPDELVSDLRRLSEGAADTGLRLLIGCRPGRDRELADSFGSRATVIDLDSPQYARMEDLVDYVRRRLLQEGVPEGVPASNTPYRGHEGVAEAVALEVARNAYPSFLIAQLVSRSLLNSRQALRPGELGWQRFPNDVAGAMQRHLSALGLDGSRVEKLLLPLAYAYGQGLPVNDLWADLAGVLGRGREVYGPAEIRELIKVAADYLIEATAEDGQTYYRLYHKALADYLLDKRDPGQNAPDRILKALLSRVPTGSAGERNWLASDDYILKHLADHATAASRLTELLEDAGFLVAANPINLFGAIMRSDEESTAAMECYRKAYPSLKGEPPEVRASYLCLSARIIGSPELAVRIANDRVLPIWSVSWVAVTREGPHYILGSHSAAVEAVVVVRSNDQTLIVSGDRDGNIRIWDYATGQSVRVDRSTHSDSVYSISSAVILNEHVIISAGRDNVICVQSLDDPGQVTKRLTGHDGWVHGVAATEVDGRSIVISCGFDRSVRVWDLERAEQVVRPLTGHSAWVFDVATAEVGGRPVAVTGGDDRTVRVWDLRSGREVAALVGHTDSVYAVATAEVGGRPVAVTGGDDRTVRVWDLRANWQSPPQTSGHVGGVLALATHVIDGRQVAISAGEDRAILVWDLLSGTALGDPILGNAESIYALTTANMNQGPVLVSAGKEGALLRWDLTTNRQIGPPLIGHALSVRALAAGVLKDRPVVLSAGGDASVRVWDLETGDMIGDPLVGHSDSIYAITTVQIDGHLLAASAGYDRTIRVWDVTTNQAIGHPLAGHSDAVYALAIARTGKGFSLLSAGGDGAVLMWDLLDGRRLEKPVAIHASAVRAIGTFKLNGKTVVASVGDDAKARFAALPVGGLQLPDPIELGSPARAIATLAEREFLVGNSIGLISFRL